MSEIQKENAFFFLFPNESIFDAVKVSNKREEIPEPPKFPEEPPFFAEEALFFAAEPLYFAEEPL
ncbi:MAG: hypothetical protein J5797_01605 [Prevotella sp.]|nr:hypothetical protein [Prevotella sp.]